MPSSKKISTRSSSQERGINTSLVAQAAQSPHYSPRPITDTGVLGRESLYQEAIHQTHPLAAEGSGLARGTRQLVQNGNARHPQLSEQTSQRMITETREMSDLIKGRHRSATAAEVVVAHDLKNHHAGSDTGMVNPANQRPQNVVDVRIAADSQARRDILFLIEDPKKGIKFYRSGGQVKTGSSSYVSRSLEVLPEKLDYGQTAYVDAKYVNADGTPRIGPEAFSEAQAQRLSRSKVRLRGFKDLEQRAGQLMEDIAQAQVDGFSPEGRARLIQLREDIAQNYRGGRLAGRIATGAATAAASAALFTLIIQAASGGEIDVKELGQASGKAALYGAGGAVAETVVYHGATKVGMAPEVAQSTAQQTIAVGFCLVAVATDIWSEVSAAKRGELTVKGAASGASAKVALDFLPLVVAPLGLFGVPILLGAQIGGRWVISRLREMDRAMDELITVDLMTLSSLQSSIDLMIEESEDVLRECEETDALFNRIMACPVPH